jgi:hypothetical protein
MGALDPNDIFKQLSNSLSEGLEALTGQSIAKEGINDTSQDQISNQEADYLSDIFGSAAKSGSSPKEKENFPNIRDYSGDMHA